MQKAAFYLTVFLLLIQFAGRAYVGTAYTLPCKTIAVLNHSAPEQTTPGIIHTSFNLQAPDAIIIPVESFHFGFIEVFCLFVLAWLSCATMRKTAGITSRFTSSYFKKLFSSLILIHAP